MVENTPSLPGKVHAKCPLSHWASFLLLHYHLGEIALGLAIHFLFDTISPGSSASIGHPLRKKQKWSIQCTHKGEFEFDDGISLSFCHCVALGGTVIYFMSSQFINTPDLDCSVPRPR